MSFDAHADALRMELPCPEKMVLAILCHYASDDTHACWASLETLSFTVGVSKQTVRNKLKSLKEKGYIKRIVERSGTTTVYVLDFAKIAKNARPRPLKEVDPSTSLTPQGDLPPPSTSLTPPLNVVDPINNDKQLKTITPSPPKGAAKETTVEKRGKALAKLLPWPDVEKVCTRYAKHKAELCKSKPWYSTEALSTKAKQLSHLQREEFIALIDKVVTSNWQGIPADFLPSVAGKPPRQRLKGFEPTYSPPKVRIAEPKKPEKATRTPEEMKQIEELRSRVVSKLLATEDPEHEEKVRKQIQEAKRVPRD